MEILDGMRKRLKRRNIFLDEVRKAYLSDLVASNAPSECTYELIHGEGIDHGGHVEIIHRESKHVADISKKVRKLLEVEQKSRLKESIVMNESNFVHMYPCLKNGSIASMKMH
mmetsp:Transcript_4126/g.11794  ORF Transcript_4126/g.11794 Transcript_4126/m.11794 type:complete len:113 (-) Transcript_4126:3067-3405(-)